MAGFFLILFAFSITPKRTLHDWVANHTDSRSASSANDPSGAQINKAGFNCACDNLVNESPFVAAVSLSSDSSTVFSSSDKSLFIECSYYAELLSYGLRGPPAC